MNTLAPLPTRARKVNASTRPIESDEIRTADPPEETLVVVKMKRIYVSSIQRTEAGVRILR